MADMHIHLKPQARRAVSVANAVFALRLWAIIQCQLNSSGQAGKDEYTGL
jgi:hypothetical protein